MLESLKEPWPWYVAGPLIGLTVPALLILGNKSFGISSSMRHICAICLPANLPFFKYDWRKEIWNLVFVAGVLSGGFLAVLLLPDPNEMVVSETLKTEWQSFGINSFNSLLPEEIMNWGALATVKGFVFMILGGFLVGFGTRYAGGCTSGHSIMGLSSLQWPSLVATICFMAGGFISAWLVVPYLLTL